MTSVRNEGELVSALKALHSSEDPTNWVLLGYAAERKNELEFTESGSGGLEEFKSKLVEDKIQYGVLEVMAEGDEYNSMKYVLVTWIGPQVPAGLPKARSSGHRKDLLDLVQKNIAIASEFQVASYDEVNYQDIAQAITKIRRSLSSAPTTQRKNMSRTKGAVHQSQMVIVNQEKAEAGLEEVFTGKADWAILTYVKGKKDEVELLKTGKGGVETLRKEFPEDQIYYCVVTLKFTTSVSPKDPVTKFILVTLTGEKTPPLQKARSGGQRKDITDFVMSVVPVHGHFQPNDTEEFTEQAILKKFHE